MTLTPMLKKIAHELNLQCVARNKKTIKQLLSIAKGVLVVYKKQIKLYRKQLRTIFPFRHHCTKNKKLRQ